MNTDTGFNTGYEISKMLQMPNSTKKMGLKTINLDQKRWKLSLFLARGQIIWAPDSPQLYTLSNSSCIRSRYAKCNLDNFNFFVYKYLSGTYQPLSELSHFSLCFYRRKLCQHLSPSRKLMLYYSLVIV